MTIHRQDSVFQAHRGSPLGSAAARRRADATQNSAQWIVVNLIRVGFMALVVGVLAGAWVVSNAHLTEQFLGAPQETQGLIDPTAGEGALTPENIERQALAFSLRLREDELYIPAGDNPRARPFVVIPGEPARFIAARLQQEGFIRDADLFNLY